MRCGSPSSCHSSTSWSCPSAATMRVPSTAIRWNTNFSTGGRSATIWLGPPASGIRPTFALVAQYTNPPVTSRLLVTSSISPICTGAAELRGLRHTCSPSAQYTLSPSSAGLNKMPFATVSTLPATSVFSCVVSLPAASQATPRSSAAKPVTVACSSASLATSLRPPHAASTTDTTKARMMRMVTPVRPWCDRSVALPLTLETFLADAPAFRLGDLPTEQPHPHTRGLAEVAERDPVRAAAMIARVDRDALDVLAGLARVIDDVLRSGGRIYLCGCGATGRLALTLETLWREQAAADDRDRVVSLMAGGDTALVRSLEGFEDHPDYGARHVAELG